MLVLAVALSAVALTLCFAQTVAVAYVLWRYSFLPWRRALGALKDMETKVSEALELARSASKANVLTMSDEEVAFRERRLRARANARGAQPMETRMTGEPGGAAAPAVGPLL